MAIRRIFQYVQQTLTATPLQIGPRAGRGYRLIEVGATGAVANEGLIVTVNDNRSIFMPCLNTLNSVCYPKFIGLQTAGFWEQIQKRFPQVPSIIAGADEDIVIERNTGAGTPVSYIIFEELTEGDIPNPTDPGGSQSEERLIVQYGGQQFTVAGSSTEIYQQTEDDMPSGFRTFPFGETVPSNRQMDFLGMVIGNDLSGAANTTVNGVRLWLKDQSILGTDEDFVPVNAFPLINGVADQRLQLMPTAVPMLANDDVRVEYSFTNSDASPETPVMFTSLLFHQKPV